jgi:hypothetical protein
MRCGVRRAGHSTAEPGPDARPTAPLPRGPATLFKIIPCISGEDGRAVEDTTGSPPCALRASLPLLRDVTAEFFVGVCRPLWMVVIDIDGWSGTWRPARSSYSRVPVRRLVGEDPVNPGRRREDAGNLGTRAQVDVTSGQCRYGNRRAYPINPRHLDGCRSVNDPWMVGVDARRLYRYADPVQVSDGDQAIVVVRGMSPQTRAPVGLGGGIPATLCRMRRSCLHCRRRRDRCRSRCCRRWYR